MGMSIDLQAAKKMEFVQACIRNKFNVAKISRETGLSEGVVRSRISGAQAGKYVDYFREYFSSPELKEKLVKTLEDGLKAEKPVVTKDGVVYAKDHGIRHKYWQDCLKVVGMLSDGGVNVNTKIQTNTQNVINFNVDPEKIRDIMPKVEESGNKDNLKLPAIAR